MARTPTSVAPSLYTTEPSAADVARRLQLLSAARQTAADPLLRDLRRHARRAAAVYADELKSRAPTGRYPASRNHPADRRYAQYGRREGQLVRAGALARTIRIKASRTRARVLIGGRYRSDEVWYTGPLIAGHALPRRGGWVEPNDFVWDASRAVRAEVSRVWQDGIDDVLATMRRTWGTDQVTGTFAAARRRAAA